MGCMFAVYKNSNRLHQKPFLLDVAKPILVSETTGLVLSNASLNSAEYKLAVLNSAQPDLYIESEN